MIWIAITVLVIWNICLSFREADTEFVKVPTVGGPREVDSSSFFEVKDRVTIIEKLLKIQQCTGAEGFCQTRPLGFFKSQTINEIYNITEMAKRSNEISELKANQNKETLDMLIRYLKLELVEAKKVKAHFKKRSN